MAQIDLVKQVQGILQVIHGGTGMSSLSSGILGTTFADAEVPAGVQNSSNVTFTLNYVPSPLLSLMLFRNGLVLQQGAGKDYTLSSKTITFAIAPASTDVVQCWYRYVAANDPQLFAGAVQQDTVDSMTRTSTSSAPYDWRALVHEDTESQGILPPTLPLTQEPEDIAKWDATWRAMQPTDIEDSHR